MESSSRSRIDDERMFLDLRPVIDHVLKRFRFPRFSDDMRSMCDLILWELIINGRLDGKGRGYAIVSIGRKLMDRSKEWAGSTFLLMNREIKRYRDKPRDGQEIHSQKSSEDHVLSEVKIAVRDPGVYDLCSHLLSGYSITEYIEEEGHPETYVKSLLRSARSNPKLQEVLR